MLSLIKKDYPWSNWSKNYSCIAERYYEPETESELREIVQAAGKKKFALSVRGIRFHLWP